MSNKYVTRDFDKETLQDLADVSVGGWLDDKLKVLECEIEETTRWSVIYSQVFFDKVSGKYYSTSYSVGATEQQDESPYEFDDDHVSCVEVEPREVTVTEYKPVLEENVQ